MSCNDDESPFLPHDRGLKDAEARILAMSWLSA